MMGREDVGRVGGWRTVVPTLLGMVLSSYPGAVAAQACLGYPQRSDGALVAGFSFPDDATGYSLGGMVSSQGGDVFFEGGFGVTAPDAEGLENTKVVRGGAAYEVQSLAPDVSVCPTAAVAYGWVEDLNSWSIPFGVGVGKTVRLGRRGDAGLTPFAIPQFLYVRTSIDDLEDSADSDVFVALGAGATLNVGAFIVSGGLSKVFEEDMDAVFSLAVGAAWR